jgi:phage baseplate assembly protein W
LTRQPYGIGLPIQRGDAGYFSQTYDIVEQTKCNLITFLQTKKGERRGFPEYGSDIHLVPFEFNNEDLPVVIENTIKRDVQRWMPELNINDIKIESTDADKDIYRTRVEIIFTINGLGISQPQSVNFFINQPTV